MIRVTQGHENGIGLEIFIKSFLLLSSTEQSKFKLYCFQESLKLTLEKSKLVFNIQDDGIIIANSFLSCEWLSGDLPESTISLNKALIDISEQEVLLTLPTSKDQLIDDGIQRAGYTEFLRARYKSDLSMLFSSPNENYLLVTDHIPLIDVTKKINSKLIHKKVKLCLDNFKKYFYTFNEVVFSGLNPHCGENGLLGDKDSEIDEAIKSLSKEYPLTFKGPLSGDTLHLHYRDKNQLFVYMYHDQGLPVFKSKNHVVGLNITLGLPFLRMSVDHGTAFNLYGKNQANYLGCHYLLRCALKAL